MVTLVALELAWALAIYLIAWKLGVRPKPVMVPLVLAPAALPMIMQIWAMAFSVEPGSPAAAAHPAIVAEMLSYLFYATVPVSLIGPALAKGYRIPAVIFALPQIPLAWFVGFVGVMQVTGVWL